MHFEDLHNLYLSLNVITQIKSRPMRWARHVAQMGDKRKVYKVLVGKPEGKKPLGRPTRRWEGSEWILGRLAGRWSEFNWLRIGIGGSLL
jgi:hypothetical protein